MVPEEEQQSQGVIDGLNRVVRQLGVVLHERIVSPVFLSNATAPYCCMDKDAGNEEIGCLDGAL